MPAMVRRSAGWVRLSAVGIRFDGKLVGPVGEVGLRGSAGGRQGWRNGGEVEMAEDPGHDGGLGEEGEDLPGSAAGGAAEDVDGEDSLEECGPVEAAGEDRGRDPGRGDDVGDPEEAQKSGPGEGARGRGDG